MSTPNLFGAQTHAPGREHAGVTCWSNAAGDGDALAALSALSLDARPLGGADSPALSGAPACYESRPLKKSASLAAMDILVQNMRAA